MVLALSLYDANLTDVNVYESAPAIKELGVGINVLRHAVRGFTDLSLLADRSAVGNSTGELIYYSKHGQRIWWSRVV